MHNRRCGKGKAARLASLLLAERAALGKACFSTCGLAEDGRAASTDDDGLCVRENGGDREAAGALDVHEK
jgi:hypothetical protein